MDKEIILQGQELNHFIRDEKDKVISFLRKSFPLSEDDLNDVYQEASMALTLNIRNGKLTNLTCTLFTYFLSICINQSKKIIGKKNRTIPLLNYSTITNNNFILTDKIDELYRICLDNEEQERINRSEMIVKNIINTMPVACKNIFRGYYWDNLSTSTIALMFGFANANSVKTQKYKCLQKFRNKYNELLDRIYG